MAQPTTCCTMRRGETGERFGEYHAHPTHHYSHVRRLCGCCPLRAAPSYLLRARLARCHTRHRSIPCGAARCARCRAASRRVSGGRSPARAALGTCRRVCLAGVPHGDRPPPARRRFEIRLSGDTSRGQRPLRALDCFRFLARPRSFPWYRPLCRSGYDRLLLRWALLRLGLRRHLALPHPPPCLVCARWTLPDWDACLTPC